VPEHFFLLGNKSAETLHLGRERKENSICRKCTTASGKKDRSGDGSSDRVSARQSQRDEFAPAPNAKFRINPVQMHFDGALA
jgi:hypothetical protein